MHTHQAAWHSKWLLSVHPQPLPTCIGLIVLSQSVAQRALQPLPVGNLVVGICGRAQSAGRFGRRSGTQGTTAGQQCFHQRQHCWPAAPTAKLTVAAMARGKVAEDEWLGVLRTVIVVDVCRARAATPLRCLWQVRLEEGVQLRCTRLRQDGGTPQLPFLQHPPTWQVEVLLSHCCDQLAKCCQVGRIHKPIRICMGKATWQQNIDMPWYDVVNPAADPAGHRPPSLPPLCPLHLHVLSDSCSQRRTSLVGSAL